MNRFEIPESDRWMEGWKGTYRLEPLSFRKLHVLTEESLKKPGESAQSSPGFLLSNGSGL